MARVRHRAAGVALIAAIVTGLGLEGDETRLANEVAFFVFFILLGIGIPTAIAVALLKYRLWDLDVVVKKAVVATIVVVAFAVLSVLALILIGGAVVGPIADNPGLTLLAGLVIGATLWPILRVSRRIADRIVYGGRATPYEVLTEFSDRLAETYSTDDVLPRMAAILGEGTGARARVWLLVGGDPVGRRPRGRRPHAPSSPDGRDELPAFAGATRSRSDTRANSWARSRSRCRANDPMNPAGSG